MGAAETREERRGPVPALTSRLSPLQEVWHQMRRLLPGHLPQRPSPESPEQSVPPELFHLHGLQQAALHGRGTVYHRRKQICLQRGLFELSQFEGRQPQLRYARRSPGNRTAAGPSLARSPRAAQRSRCRSRSRSRSCRCRGFFFWPHSAPWTGVGEVGGGDLGCERSPRAPCGTQTLVEPEAAPRTAPTELPTHPPIPGPPLRGCPVPPRRGPDPSPPFTQRQSSHLTSLEAVSASGPRDQAPSCWPSSAGRPCSPPAVGSFSVQHPGPDPATRVSGAAAVSEASRAWPGWSGGAAGRGEPYSRQ